MPLDAELAALGEEIAKLKERRERGWRKWAYAIAAAGPVPSPAELAAALSEPRAIPRAEVDAVLADVLDRVRRRSWTYYDGTPLPLQVQEELDGLSRRQHPQPPSPASPARSQPQQTAPPARSQPQCLPPLPGGGTNRTSPSVMTSTEASASARRSSPRSAFHEQQEERALNQRDEL
eukprot:TRINITY_DN14223_c0_g1_i6.p1 TRINITY_DN14223_c0_g1~~TRINITY_DN14223_c0_g1_i6.p1  ORF type:complete len:207 (+),score=59.83 TRINITY_DN14223_c0_g1_i6:92-622(+)